MSEWKHLVYRVECLSMIGRRGWRWSLLLFRILGNRALFIANRMIDAPSVLSIRKDRSDIGNPINHESVLRCSDRSDFGSIENAAAMKSTYVLCSRGNGTDFVRTGDGRFPSQIEASGLTVTREAEALFAMLEQGLEATLSWSLSPPHRGSHKTDLSLVPVH